MKGFFALWAESPWLGISSGTVVLSAQPYIRLLLNSYTYISFTLLLALFCPLKIILQLALEDGLEPSNGLNKAICSFFFATQIALSWKVNWICGRSMFLNFSTGRVPVNGAIVIFVRSVSTQACTGCAYTPLSLNCGFELNGQGWSWQFNSVNKFYILCIVPVKAGLQMQKAVQIQQPAVEEQCAAASVNINSSAFLSTVSQGDDSDWFQCG